MHKDKKGRRQTVAILLALLLLATGCNNPKDALHLEATTLMARIPQGVPVRVRLTFAASEGRVCISKPNAGTLNCELVWLDGDANFRQGQIVKCGMMGLLLLPFYPFTYAGCLLDVADLGGRFSVVSPAHPCVRQFLIVSRRDHFYLMEEVSKDYRKLGKKYPPLPPGRYRLMVRFKGKESEVYPPPFFWDVYEQPVSSVTEFQIVVAD